MTSQPAGPAVRRANQEAVLRALHERTEATASELMAATGLSRPTIHAVCEELAAANLVVEIDSLDRPAARGRRPRSYAFNAGSAYVVGIDFGYSTTRAVTTDLRGTVHGEATEPIPDGTAARGRIKAVRSCLGQAIRSAGITRGAVRAVGVGMPAPVGDDNRVVALPAYLRDLPKADVAAAISGRDRWPVLLENDANLAVIAETRVGAAQGARDVVALLAGERLGAGVVLGHRLLRGAGGATGEISWASLVRGVDGAYGIGHRAREAGREALGSAGERERRVLAERCHNDPEQLTAEQVFQAAAAGDALARRVAASATEPVARVIVLLQLLLDPAQIVVSGAVADAPALVDTLEQHLPNLPENVLHPVRLVASTLGARAVALGAACLAVDDVWRQLEQDPQLLVPTRL